MFNEATPQQGSLLLSEPFMSDPTFERAVVLLCEHDAEGTLGLILNNPTHLILSDIIENIGNVAFPIFLGGPVEPNVLFYIHRAYDKLQSGTPIKDDVYWGGDFDKLLALIQDKVIGTEDIKFFLGYSGWSPDQLSMEIKQNSWGVHTSFDTDLLFVHDGENLWKQALISLGPKYAHVANFPKSPNLN